MSFPTKLLDEFQFKPRFHTSLKTRVDVLSFFGGRIQKITKPDGQMVLGRPMQDTSIPSVDLRVVSKSVRHGSFFALIGAPGQFVIWDTQSFHDVMAVFFMGQMINRWYPLVSYFWIFLIFWGG